MAAQSTISAQSQFAQEFSLESKSWFDRFVNNLNRLPRPVLVIITIAYFLTSFISPEKFKAINEGLATVPESMWYVLLTIIGFYFGARHLEKRLVSNVKKELIQIAVKNEPVEVKEIKQKRRRRRSKGRA